MPTPPVEPIAWMGELSREIKLLINYNWEDERRDFEENNCDRIASATFVRLVRLRNWCYGVDDCPEQFVRCNGCEQPKLQCACKEAEATAASLERSS